MSHAGKREMANGMLHHLFTIHLLDFRIGEALRAPASRDFAQTLRERSILKSGTSRAAPASPRAIVRAMRLPALVLSVVVAVSTLFAMPRDARA